ncbi:MAG: hypothetical protein L6Q84_28500, partial [Polyangiaceae bacterium]|nr:hypothetical protein [Polyangiaceae bacterium]
MTFRRWWGLGAGLSLLLAVQGCDDGTYDGGGDGGAGGGGGSGGTGPVTGAGVGQACSALEPCRPGLACKNAV